LGAAIRHLVPLVRTGRMSADAHVLLGHLTAELGRPDFALCFYRVRHALSRARGGVGRDAECGSAGCE
jgi:hypothetical protein